MTVDIVAYIVAGLFLPLYPLSIGFNWIYGRVGAPWLRALLLILWPAIGVGILAGLSVHGPVPAVLAAWGAFSALLYAVRMISLRELDRWIAFLFSSAVPLVWLVLAADGLHPLRLLITVTSFAAPLAVLALLAGLLARRFGAAHCGLYRGLGVRMPRFAVLWSATLLAAIATPFSPAFAALFDVVEAASPTLVLVPLIAWLLWGWAGLNVLHGLVFGPPADHPAVADVARAPTAVCATALIALLVAGVHLMGVSP